MCNSQDLIYITDNDTVQGAAVTTLHYKMMMVMILSIPPIVANAATARLDCTSMQYIVTACVYVYKRIRTCDYAMLLYFAIPCLYKSVFMCRAQIQVLVNAQRVSQWIT